MFFRGICPLYDQFSRRVTMDRIMDHYSLQMIIAVGFKVNNQRAVQFRKWALPGGQPHVFFRGICPLYDQFSRRVTMDPRLDDG